VTRPAGIERKSEREIEIMRAAGHIVAATLAELRDHAHPGVTPRQLDALAERLIVQHGAQAAFKDYPGPYPFPASTCISVNEAVVHGIPGKRALKEGDLVTIDCGVLYQGYYADAAISFGVGRCSADVEKLLMVTETALWAAISRMRPGIRTGNISAIIQQTVERNGYNVLREYTSHGVGREMHEEPYIYNYGKADTGPILRPGMTIAVEPMVLAGKSEVKTLADRWTVVSADKKLTAHMEHTVVVTEGEPEILTRL
jgi:methionyl aminopeptidase